MKTQVAPKNVNILSRDVIKRNGVILYTILSSDGITKYFATVEHGKVTAHDCPGYINRGTCRHAQYIEQAEAIAQYDVVGKALQVVNQAMINAKIGTFYEDVVTRQAPLYSEVCGHLVKSDVHSHCGCLA